MIINPVSFFWKSNKKLNFVPNRNDPSRMYNLIIQESGFKAGSQHQEPENERSYHKRKVCKSASLVSILGGGGDSKRIRGSILFSISILMKRL